MAAARNPTKVKEYIRIVVNFVPRGCQSPCRLLWPTLIVLLGSRIALVGLLAAVLGGARESPANEPTLSPLLEAEQSPPILEIATADPLPIPAGETAPPFDSPAAAPWEDAEGWEAGYRPLPEMPAPAEAPPPLPPFSLQPVFARASGDEAPALLLTMREVVRLALENNTEVKVQRLQPELAEEQVRFARGAFDPNFNFSTVYDYSETPQNAVEFVSTGGEAGVTPGFKDPRNFKSEAFTMGYGLQGLTPMGTTYEIGLSQLQARNDLNIQIPPSLFFPEYTTVFGLTLTQPLLKNFGPAANLAALRVARIQREIGWLEWEQHLISSLAQCLSLYIDLVFARENLRVREGAVQTARLLEQQNIRRVEAGRMRPSDVWEAQTSLANNADLALRAVNAYVESQNILKALIFSAADLATGPTGRLEPVDSLHVSVPALERNAFVRAAFTRRPEYLRLQAAAEQEGIKVRYARNQLYPQVDLQASYGLTGLEGNYGDSFSGAFAGQGPAFAVGVVVSVPLGNQQERANLQSAKLRQEQAALALQRSVIDITLEIDTAVSLVRTTGEQVKTAAQTSRSARLTAEAQEKLLEEGKATTFDVVRLQNDYADARSRELAALANQRKALLRLSVARGTLLDELGITLDPADGPSAALPGRPVHRAAPAR